MLQADLGDGVLVVPEGLNGRTTVLDDPNENPFFCGQDGAGMNGRRQLLPCLHSHKPVSVVVIALGCNDMKTSAFHRPIAPSPGLHPHPPQPTS